YLFLGPSPRMVTQTKNVFITCLPHYIKHSGRKNFKIRLIRCHAAQNIFSIIHKLIVLSTVGKHLKPWVSTYYYLMKGIGNPAFDICRSSFIPYPKIIWQQIKSVLYTTVKTI